MAAEVLGIAQRGRGGGLLEGDREDNSASAGPARAERDSGHDDESECEAGFHGAMNAQEFYTKGQTRDDVIGVKRPCAGAQAPFTVPGPFRRRPAAGRLDRARARSGTIFAGPRSAADVKARDLHSAPIPKPWILSGTPEARNKHLAKSHDRTSNVIVWDCTPGHFNWHYSEDETVVVISGEVFITSEKGEEGRLGQGDMGFFPAGSSCTWRVTDRIKKIAT